MNKKIYALLICYCLAFNILLAQTSPCTPACLNITTGKTTVQMSKYNYTFPLLPCGGGAVEIDSPYFLSFRAKTNSVSINCNVLSCTSNSCAFGAQFSVYEIGVEPCSNFTMLGCVEGASGNLTFQTTPGKLYVIMVIGFCQSLCSFTLTYNNAQFLKTVPAPVITGPNSLCKGATSELCATIPSLNSALLNYKWSISPSSAATITTNTSCASVKVNNIPANGKLTVTCEPLFSAVCAPQTTKTTYEINVFDLKPATCNINLCPEQKPYEFNLLPCIQSNNPTLIGTVTPNTYTINLPAGTKKTQKINYVHDDSQCSSDVTLNINVFNSKSVQIPPVFVTETKTSTVKGVTYTCSDASLVPKKTVQTATNKPVECDSTFETIVQCLKAKPKIVGAADINCINKSVILNAGTAATITQPNNLTNPIFTGQGTRSYTWSRNGITLANQTQSTLTVTDEGLYTVTLTYTYSITQPFNGQITTFSEYVSETASVQVNKNTASATITSNSPICSGNSLTLQTDSASFYSWQGPNGFTSNSPSPSIPNISINNQGIYAVTITGANGCSAIGTTTVTVSNNPTVATISSNSPICEGQTATFSSSGGINYKWEGPNGFTTNTNSFTLPDANLSNQGTYNVTITDTGGCFVTIQTQLIVNALPKANIAPIAPICENNDITLYANGGTTYSWLGANNFVSNNQNPNISNLTLQNTGLYIVTVSDNMGCTDTTQVWVEILPKPILSINSNAPICENNQLNISANGGTNYYWKAPNGNSIASSQNTIVVPNVTTIFSGTYYTTVTSVNGCQSNDSISVKIHPSPKVLIQTNSPVCIGNSVVSA